MVYPEIPGEISPRPGSTRILVIVSDGRYKGTQHADGQKLITRLAGIGLPGHLDRPERHREHDDRRAGGHPGRPRRHQPAVARAVAASARTA